MKNLLTLAILLSGLLIALPATANAGTLYVDDKGHCGGNTPCFHNIQNAIQNAIDAATAGDTVYVYEGTYNEDITLKSGVIVQGEGAEVTTIQGTGSTSVVTATNVDSSAKIDGFTITGGFGSYGGGIALINSSPTISNNIISGNYSSNVGGGIGNSFYSSNAIITNNIISNNTALWHGGGIGLYQAFAIITNNIISNNTAEGYNGKYTGYGGGIGVTTYSVTTITNNTIVNNTATQQGGAIGNKDSWATLTNNIISSNIQGGIRHDVRHDEINIPNITIDYNDVWGNSEYQYLNCSAGKYDISQDPLFVGSGNYHLLGNSPCIDVGNNDASSIPDTDFDGNPRKVDGDGDGDAVVDIGAFEYILWIGVQIDIKPGSYPNSINPNSRGKIPVAILTTDTFDAANVDASTVLFGRTGTEASPVHSSLEDVDRDGDMDIILHFNTQDTGIVCGDTSASLTGETLSGQAIEGSDSIKTVSCK